MFTIGTNIIIFVVAVISSVYFIIPDRVGGQEFLMPGYEKSSVFKGWVKLYTMPATWLDAREICWREYRALVASPSDEGAKKELMSLMERHKINAEIHTGINDLLSRGCYMNGEGMLLFNMNVEWESTHNVGHCITLLHTGLVRFQPCKRHLPFVCVKQEAHYKIYDCGAFHPGYVKLNESCYIFHEWPETWADAVEVCASDGAHLAVINSKEEMQAYVDTFNEYDDKDIPGHGVKNYAFLGFHNKFDTGWLTIKGDTLNRSGYNEWGRHGPGEGPCGAMARTGTLHEAHCKYALPFICEKLDSGHKQENKTSK